MPGKAFRYDTAAPVLVTGATGYVAGWLIRRLLAEGFTVHAAVRDPDNAEQLAPVRARERDLPGRLTFFRADRLKDGRYAEAMQTCRVVFHTASPFASVVNDPQRDLVDPALNGTRNVLSSANRTETVERVVLTSSCAAIFGDVADVALAPDGILTEDVWNTSSNLDHQPYNYSKTLAEREAWRIAGSQARWRLVAINPGLVIGPALSSAPTSESFNIVRQLGDGSVKAGVPRYEIGMVDVRDVAEAHLRAGFLQKVEGRHIVSAEVLSLIAMSRILRRHFGDAWPFPRRVLPKWLVWLVGPIVNPMLDRAMVARNMGYSWRADNSKSRRALGLHYRPLAPALVAMFQQMVAAGLVPPGSTACGPGLAPASGDAAQEGEAARERPLSGGRVMRGAAPVVETVPGALVTE
ncbi:MAG: NAD-dependent epimerase/dehydratase family protein [Nitratireductor sp.]